jgi:hypothetical protein
MYDTWMLLSERCNEKLSKLKDADRSTLLHKLKVDLGMIKEEVTS